MNDITEQREQQGVVPSLKNRFNFHRKLYKFAKICTKCKTNSNLNITSFCIIPNE